MTSLPCVSSGLSENFKHKTTIKNTDSLHLSPCLLTSPRRLRALGAHLGHVHSIWHNVLHFTVQKGQLSHLARKSLSKLHQLHNQMRVLEMGGIIERDQVKKQKTGCISRASSDQLTGYEAEQRGSGVAKERREGREMGRKAWPISDGKEGSFPKSQNYLMTGKTQTSVSAPAPGSRNHPKYEL